MILLILILLAGCESNTEIVGGFAGPGWKKSGNEYRYEDREKICYGHPLRGVRCEVK